MPVVRPRYGDGSLAEVLPGVLTALGVAPTADPLGLAADLAGVRRVAVLLVDGFGYEQLPLAAQAGATLADLAAGRIGRLRQITSGFPSTTPTSLVTVGAGVPPGRHGVIGFNVNVPGTSRVLTHIQWVDDPDPRQWQPVTTQFVRASRAGVATTIVARSRFAGSGLTVSAYGDVTYVAADTAVELAEQMLAALTRPEPPTLVYGYHADLDTAGHRHGVDSPEWREAAKGVDELLERVVSGLPPDAALVVTADHGQLNVPPEHRFHLEADPRLREGLHLVAGEPRVRYLHPVPGAVEDVLATWRGVLGDAAWVATREQVVDEGWFGPVDPDHLARVGEVVAVCRGHHVILAPSIEPGASALVGFHGSWTSAEMLVPLAVLPAA